MNEVLDTVLRKLSPSHMTPEDAQAKGACAWCGKPFGPFRDDLSRKEAGISGFCQKCQDETFGK